MTEAEALEILKRDDDDIRKGYFCINDFTALEVAKKALEKQIAKKPNKIERKRDEYGFIYQLGECPLCGKMVTDDRQYCDCGQRLNWEDSEV